MKILKKILVALVAWLLFPALWLLLAFVVLAALLVGVTVDVTVSTITGIYTSTVRAWRMGLHVAKEAAPTFKNSLCLMVGLPITPPKREPQETNDV